MAHRRMIALSIIDTDRFNDMPVTSRLLYFELSLRADDDGFISSPKKITRMVDCSQSDIEKLVENGYLISFDNGTVVLAHWRISNQIKKDRYTPTLYQTEYSMLTEKNGVYSLKSPDCIQNVSKMEPQDSIGKVSEDKDSTEESISLFKNGESARFDYLAIIDLFNSICKSLNRADKLTDARKQAMNSARMHLGDLSFEELFKRVAASDFLTGRVSDWKCSFDWILKPANLAKILEGNYDNKPTQKPTQHAYEFDYDEMERVL